MLKNYVKHKKEIISAALIAVLSAQLLLSGCAAKESTQIELRPDEGVDTVTEITGYTDHSDDDIGSFLKEGDKIAVISPSALPTQEQVDAVMKGLKEWGYEPVEGEYACVEERTLQDCIDDLTWALEDPEIKAIFCVRGGCASNEVMDEMSLELIQKADKPIIGFSDITVYHSAWTMAGVPSIHASMSGAFMDLPDECVTAEQKILQGQIPVYKCEADEYCIEGSAKGILIGGNLATFTSIVGTEYDASGLDEPYILFLEDVDESFENIQRYLTVLKHMGVLENAQAIVFGEWTEQPADPDSCDGNSRGGKYTCAEDLISRQFVQELGIPVAFGFPAGHGDINYPLLMGEEVCLTVSDGSFTLEWK